MGENRIFAVASLVAAATTAVLLSPPAQGATSTLRPDADITSAWAVSGAPSAWDALNDITAQPTAPAGGDQITSGGPNRITEVALSAHPLGSEHITGGTAWFHIGAGILSSARVEVIWGGAVRGNTTVSGGLLGSSAQWRSITATPPDQAAVDDLRLRFTSTAGSSVTVRAAYFQLETEAPPPALACPLAEPESLIGLSLPDCSLIASDTSAASDPLPFWGKVDCEADTRHQRLIAGGDLHPTGAGAPQGDVAYRRLTAIDGDDAWGERCELGYNWNSATDPGNGLTGPGPTVLYSEGQRRVTYASLRLPASADVNDPDWRVVLQMKQTQPYANNDHHSMFELQVRSGNWLVISDWNDLWTAPAHTDRWTRFAFDVVYSQNPAVGSIRVYVDLNDDGDVADAGERSPLFRRQTLIRETASGGAVAPGQSVPSHLRAGIYQNENYSCPAPAGCHVDVDNVQVVAP